MRRFVLVLVYVLYFTLEFELSIIKEKYEKVNIFSLLLFRFLNIFIVFYIVWVVGFLFIFQLDKCSGNIDCG